MPPKGRGKRRARSPDDDKTSIVIGGEEEANKNEADNVIEDNQNETTTSTTTGAAAAVSVTAAASGGGGDDAQQQQQQQQQHHHHHHQGGGGGGGTVTYDPNAPPRPQAKPGEKHFDTLFRLNQKTVSNQGEANPEYDPSQPVIAVFNIHIRVSKQYLRDFFSKYGRIKDFLLVRDSSMCYVGFEKIEDCDSIFAKNPYDSATGDTRLYIDIPGVLEKYRTLTVRKAGAPLVNRNVDKSYYVSMDFNIIGVTFQKNRVDRARIQQMHDAFVKKFSLDPVEHKITNMMPRLVLERHTKFRAANFLIEFDSFEASQRIVDHYDDQVVVFDRNEPELRLAAKLSKEGPARLPADQKSNFVSKRKQREVLGATVIGGDGGGAQQEAALVLDERGGGARGGFAGGGGRGGFDCRGGRGGGFDGDFAPRGGFTGGSRGGANFGRGGRGGTGYEMFPEGSCYNCGEFGHVRAACPQREYVISAAAAAAGGGTVGSSHNDYERDRLNSASGYNAAASADFRGGDYDRGLNNNNNNNQPWFPNQTCCANCGDPNHSIRDCPHPTKGEKVADFSRDVRGGYAAAAVRGRGGFGGADDRFEIRDPRDFRPGSDPRQGGGSGGSLSSVPPPPPSHSSSSHAPPATFSSHSSSSHAPPATFSSHSSSSSSSSSHTTVVPGPAPQPQIVVPGPAPQSQAPAPSRVLSFFFEFTDHEIPEELVPEDVKSMLQPIATLMQKIAVLPQTNPHYPHIINVLIQFPDHGVCLQVIEKWNGYQCKSSLSGRSIRLKISLANRQSI